MDENKDVQKKTKETKTEAEETKTKEKKISIFTLSSPLSNLATALQKASSQSFGYEADKQLYRLLKEIRGKCEEYTEMKDKIIKNHGVQKNGMVLLQGEGIKLFATLNDDLGAQEVVLEHAPIKIGTFPAGVSAGDMLLLEDNGIFRIDEKGK